MIKGLTHSADGVLNSIVKYKGKISAGWQANEGPNKKNSPAACGFFRFMKQINVNRVVNGKNEVYQEWAHDAETQKKLIAENNGSATPRILEFMCMYQTPDMIFESFMAKFSQSDGILCKSFGAGTTPTQLVIDAKGGREWKPRQFNGKAECPYDECPDYTCKPQKCKEMGVLKVFPLSDLSAMPYRFETRSKNTILAIGSSLDSMYNLAKAAWLVQCKEAGKRLPFEGLFGIKMRLVHKQIKSGGNEVFITQVEPGQGFSASIMNIIKRGIEGKQKAALIGSSDMLDLSLLSDDSQDEEQLLLPTPSLSLSDEKSVAKDFAPEQVVDNSDLDAAAEALKNL